MVGGWVPHPQPPCRSAPRGAARGCTRGCVHPLEISKKSDGGCAHPRTPSRKNTVMKPKTAKYSAGQNHIWTVIYLDRKNVPVAKKPKKFQNFYGPSIIRSKIFTITVCPPVWPLM